MYIKMRSEAFLFLFLFSILYFSSGNNELKAQDPLQVSESENKLQSAFLAARLESVSGHYDKAMEVLDSLAKVHRNRAMIYYEMALLYIEQKNYTKASEKLQRALDLEDNNFWFVERMAFVQTELAQLNHAIDYYQKLITMSPKSAKYYDMTADLMLMSNRQAEAMNLLMKKETQVGFSEINSLKITDIALDIRRYDVANGEIEKLIQKKQPKLLHLKKAVQVYRAQGNTEKVNSLQQKILEIDPNDVDAMLDKMEREQGKVDETSYLISLQPIIQNRSVPVESKVRELMPFVEGHAQNPNVSYVSALLNICASLANAHPEDARVHSIYGDVLMNSKREVEAVRQYQRTLEISKNNFMVWEQLMYGLEFLGEFEKLGETADEAIDYFPNQAISYYFRAVSDFHKGVLPSAKEFLTEATMISAKNPMVMSRVYLLQSKISFTEKKTEEAMNLADKSIETSLGLMGASFEWKGDMLLAKGQSEAAKKMFYKASELMPDSKTLPGKISALP